MHKDGEPSVEEILDSIKKVIARDSAERAQPTRRRGLVAGQDGAGAQNDADGTEDVLELGTGLGEELILEDDASLDAAFGPEEDFGAGEYEDTDEQPAPSHDASLITDATRSAMQQNFAALTMMARPGKKPQIVRQGETSLEGMVREMLRPMLAKWLDDNLPSMVEDLVKAEIARIAGKKR